MDPSDVAAKQFLIGMRGYVREEVHAFLRAVADQLAERDARIAELERRLDAISPERERFLQNWVPEVASLLWESTADELRGGGDVRIGRDEDLRTKLVEVQIVLAGLANQLGVLTAIPHAGGDPSLRVV